MPQSLHCKDGCGWFRVEPADEGIATNDLRNQKSITNRFRLKMNSEYASRSKVSITSSDLFGMSGLAGDLSATLFIWGLMQG
jgi:hypothetical protein